MNYEIIHNEAQNRFYTELEGHTAYVEYVLTDGRLDITHTIVPSEIGGRGIAAALVKTAYDFALANGLKPAATCTYAAKWLERHPDYQGI